MYQAATPRRIQIQTHLLSYFDACIAEIPIRVIYLTDLTCLEIFLGYKPCKSDDVFLGTTLQLHTHIRLLNCVEFLPPIECPSIGLSSSSTSWAMSSSSIHTAKVLNWKLHVSVQLQARISKPIFVGWWNSTYVTVKRMGNLPHLE